MSVSGTPCPPLVTLLIYSAWKKQYTKILAEENARELARKRRYQSRYFEDDPPWLPVEDFLPSPNNRPRRRTRRTWYVALHTLFLSYCILPRYLFDTYWVATWCCTTGHWIRNFRFTLPVSMSQNDYCNKPYLRSHELQSLTLDLFLARPKQKNTIGWNSSKDRQTEGRKSGYNLDGGHDCVVCSRSATG